jgi:hypothetical protein
MEGPMGREAKKMKERECQQCHGKLVTDANGLKKHAAMCIIARRSGLILPGMIERPGVKVLIP